MKPILKHTVALAALLTLSFSAAAHRVNLFAWSEGNAVQVESKFSDSTPVKGKAHRHRYGDREGARDRENRG